jgi:hypothetical protein
MFPFPRRRDTLSENCPYGYYYKGPQKVGIGTINGKTIPRIINSTTTTVKGKEETRVTKINSTEKVTNATERVKETNVTQKGKETNVTEKGKETNVTEKGKETNVTERVKEMNVTEKGKETNATERVKETGATQKGKETNVTERVKEMNVMERVKETNATERVKETSATQKGKETTKVSGTKLDGNLRVPKITKTNSSGRINTISNERTELNCEDSSSSSQRPNAYSKIISAKSYTNSNSKTDSHSSDDLPLQPVVRYLKRKRSSDNRDNSPFKPRSTTTVNDDISEVAKNHKKVKNTLHNNCEKIQFKDNLEKTLSQKPAINSVIVHSKRTRCSIPSIPADSTFQRDIAVISNAPIQPPTDSRYDDPKTSVTVPEKPAIIIPNQTDIVQSYIPIIRPLCTRPSIPAFRTTRRDISDISKALVQATIESGYDEPASSICTRLPNDIILLIFHNLKNSDDLRAVACVSKRWLILASDPGIWKSLYEIYYGPKLQLTSETRSWKYNFLTRKKDIELKQSQELKYYNTKKKKTNQTSSSRLTLDELMENIIPIVPPKQQKQQETTKKNTRLRNQPSQNQDFELDQKVLALLEEKKQLFDSFGSMTLATTPFKKPTIPKLKTKIR